MYWFQGSLSDLTGRKAILIMTLLICSVAYIETGLTNSIAVILVCRAVLGKIKQKYGIINACSQLFTYVFLKISGFFKQTQMLTKAMVPDYEANEQKQGETYGKMVAISGAGITLGPVIGGHIAEDYPEYGFTFISAIVGFCFVLNAGEILSDELLVSPAASLAF